jgi:hypothetical protein
MKKFIFLSILLIVCVVISAQVPLTQRYTMYVGVTDTSITIPLATVYPLGLDVNYKAFDDVDAELNLGSTPHPDSLTFNVLDDLRLPYTMGDSTVSFLFPDGYPHGWLIVKITTGSVTPGLKTYLTIKMFK